jgi:hypothetical protein
MRRHFHLLYRPAEGSTCDRIISLFQADSAEDVLLRMRAYPGALAMELDAEDLREAAMELLELGFTW